MARHGDLADQLMAWRNKPEGPIEPVKSNWSVVPANDNNPEDVDGLRVEKRREFIPSVDAIKRAFQTGDTERNAAGQIVRIGALRFSDGAQTERAYCYGPEGKLVRYDAPMPIGAMLNTSEKAKVDAGTGSDPHEVAASNRYFADVLDAAPFRHVPGSRKKLGGKSYTATESKAMLAEAWGNTNPAKVTYTYGPTALPCGGQRVSDSFVGMRKASCADSGSMAWEDITSSIVHREVWMETVAALSTEDAETLDAAMTAKSYADVGVAVGQARNYADKRSGGRRRLEAANDNLRMAIKRAA